MRYKIIALCVVACSAYACDEECDSEKFSSYCDGNTIVYCAYDGGIEDADKQTVIHEECADGDPNTPFCVEVADAKDPDLRARCVISKTKTPDCSAEEPLKRYCKNNSIHHCYYEYLTWVSGRSSCSEQTSSEDQSALTSNGAI